MMVRSARFAFDDESQQPLPDNFDGFTDEDDRMLEDFLSSPRSNPSTKREPRKHLADADWTNPGKNSSRQRTEKST